MLHDLKHDSAARHLAQVAKEWDRSGRLTNRVAAAHATNRGRPLPETVYDDIFEAIDRVVGFRETDHVLEVGAGSGLLLERIANRVKHVVGTDLSENMLNLVPRRSNITVTQMAAARLTFPDATFDKVVSYSVTMYSPDLDYARTCCAEMLRVCKSGGFVYIGDVLNGYLELAFLAKEARTLDILTKMKRIANKALRRGTPRYLFIEPSTLRHWADELGCSGFTAYIQTSTSKPLFHRQFRYDCVFQK